jgi:hypothetical protein
VRLLGRRAGHDEPGHRVDLRVAAGQRAADLLRDPVGERVRREGEVGEGRLPRRRHHGDVHRVPVPGRERGQVRLLAEREVGEEARERQLVHLARQHDRAEPGEPQVEVDQLHRAVLGHHDLEVGGALGDAQTLVEPGARRADVGVTGVVVGEEQALLHHRVGGELVAAGEPDVPDAAATHERLDRQQLAPRLLLDDELAVRGDVVVHERVGDPRRAYLGGRGAQAVERVDDVAEHARGPVGRLHHGGSVEPPRVPRQRLGQGDAAQP